MRSELVKQFSEEKMVKIDAIIDEYSRVPGTLLLALEKTQDIASYLPVNLQRYLADRMGIPPSKVYGVVTFYSYFSTVPKGRKIIKVCTGTACHVKRAGEIMERLKQKIGVAEGEISADGEYSIEEVLCPGACGLAPVVVIGEEIFGLIDPEHPEEIIEKT